MDQLCIAIQTKIEDSNKEISSSVFEYTCSYVLLYTCTCIKIVQILKDEDYFDCTCRFNNTSWGPDTVQSWARGGAESDAERRELSVQSQTPVQWCHSVLYPENIGWYVFYSADLYDTIRMTTTECKIGVLCYRG